MDWMLGIFSFFLAGLYLRMWFMYISLRKIEHYLFEADEERQKEITEFMEGFSEAITVFMENEAKSEVIQNNAEAIREWDES
jgi:hypothetical protein